MSSELTETGEPETGTRSRLISVSDANNFDVVIVGAGTDLVYISNIPTTCFGGLKVPSILDRVVESGRPT